MTADSTDSNTVSKRSFLNVLCTFEEKKIYKVYFGVYNNMKEKHRETCKSNADISHKKNLKLLTVEPAWIYEWEGESVQDLKPPQWNSSGIYQISVLQAFSINIDSHHTFSTVGVINYWINYKVKCRCSYGKNKVWMLFWNIYIYRYVFWDD